MIFTLAVLVAVNASNFYDRQVLAAVQEKVRKAWSLSDFDLGWMGTAFILLYAVVGLPLGRLADTMSRRRLLSVGVGLWSLMTVASAYAWNYAALFACRMGVGIGEASCAPVAGSLIGDLVPPERRARSMALFMLGLPLGLALSFFVSGTIAQHSSWQNAFLVAGLPGVALAVLALWIADPPRAQAGPASDAARGRPTVWDVATRVLRRPTMLWLIASGALHNFNMYALGTFISSFFQRYHHVDSGRAGLISGFVYGVGAVGITLAGWVADRAFRRGPGARLVVSSAGMAAAVPCLVLALWVPAGHEWQCAAWLLPACLFLYTYYGTVYASIQDVTEPFLRGQAMAIYFGGMYLLGAVLGPVATGWLSDTFARRAASLAGSVEVLEVHKAVGLHDAMGVVPLLSAVLVLVLFAAARTIGRDVARLEPGDQAARAG